MGRCCQRRPSEDLKCAYVSRRVLSPSIGRLAIMPPAAFAVHQFRYELAYGSQAGVVLRETGHSYLHSAVPWLVALVGVAAGSFLTRVGRAFATRTSARDFSVSFGALWALCALALVAIFACQETLEGIFATGHPSGWTGVFGDGGYWAIPVAGCVGFVLAAIFHGARWVVRRAALWRRRPPCPRRTGRRALRPAAVDILSPAPVLSGWSSRGPPG